MILSTIRSIPADVRTSSSPVSIAAFSGARLEAQNIEAKTDPASLRTMGVNMRVFAP